LFGWRRQVREAQAVVSKDDEPRFVPAVVDAAPSNTAAPRQRKTTRRHWDEPLAGTIEVAIDGVMVRIGPGAPADTIAVVLRALKAYPSAAGRLVRRPVSDEACGFKASLKVG